MTVTKPVVQLYRPGPLSHRHVTRFHFDNMMLDIFLARVFFVINLLCPIIIQKRAYIYSSPTIHRANTYQSPRRWYMPYPVMQTSAQSGTNTPVDASHHHNSKRICFTCMWINREERKKRRAGRCYSYGFRQPQTLHNDIFINFAY